MKKVSMNAAEVIQGGLASLSAGALHKFSEKFQGNLRRSSSQNGKNREQAKEDTECFCRRFNRIGYDDVTCELADDVGTFQHSEDSFAS